MSQSQQRKGCEPLYVVLNLLSEYCSTRKCRDLHLSKGSVGEVKGTITNMNRCKGIVMLFAQFLVFILMLSYCGQNKEEANFRNVKTNWRFAFHVLDESLSVCDIAIATRIGLLSTIYSSTLITVTFK